MINIFNPFAKEDRSLPLPPYNEHHAVTVVNYAMVLMLQITSDDDHSQQQLRAREDPPIPAYPPQWN